ncbi:MAG: LptE family protein [Acidobacteriota bacterium]|nr:LptE family protein [Acidobacteriota bacterium]
MPTFKNDTVQYRIEQRFTEAVIREFITRTKYRIVSDPASADAVLRGEILSIDTSPVLFDATTGQVTTMLVTVHAKIALSGADAAKPVYANNDMVFRSEYQIPSNVNTFFQQEDPALERMARDFASNLVANILEGF